MCMLKTCLRDPCRTVEEMQQHSRFAYVVVCCSLPVGLRVLLFIYIQASFSIDAGDYNFALADALSIELNHTRTNYNLAQARTDDIRSSRRRLSARVSVPLFEGCYHCRCNVRSADVHVDGQV